MSFDIVSAVLASDLAASGTVNVNYPTGRGKGNYTGAVGHRASALQADMAAPADFTLTFNTSNITFTLGAGKTTIPAGSTLGIQLERQGEDDGRPVDPAAGTVLAPMLYVDLGSPIAAAATGVTTAQILGAAGNLAIDGTKATGGVAVLDVPRALTLTVATTNQSGVTFTVTGTDKDGVVMTESRAGPNANTVALKKAFKTVTQVAASAAVATNGVSVGFGDVLGLPVALPTVGLVIKELEAGAAPTAGTVVAADTAKATATTGDVRGTYDPSSACDGALGFVLLCALPDPSYKGGAQA